MQYPSLPKKRRLQYYKTIEKEWKQSSITKNRMKNSWKNKKLDKKKCKKNHTIRELIMYPSFSLSVRFNESQD